MRRNSFLSNDPALLEELARSCAEGYLALAPRSGATGPDGSGARPAFPRAIPVNFALQAEEIVFHGALAGDKFERIGAGTPAGFTLARPLAVIPSHWSEDGGSACPATQLYLSVEAYGRCVRVDEPIAQVRALQALMEKYQPEGGYRPLDADDPGYRVPLQATGVFRLEIEAWTGKVRLGQEKPPAVRRHWIDRLRARGLQTDQETADRIARTLAAENSGTQ